MTAAADPSKAVLLLSCPDRVGLVARIANFIDDRGGYNLDLNEQVDVEEHHFCRRVSWSLDHFSIPAADLESAFTPLAREFRANWQIRLSGKRNRMAIFVSKYDHCLREILWRHSLGEFDIDIPLIVSNHADLAPLAEAHGIPFHVIAVTAETKAEAERRQMALCDEHGIDTIVLARYMQVLSPEFTGRYTGRIINIHHSFLPAFVGGNPYRQAYRRGVKLIGATSHYVSDELDEGPIIEQDIIRISHRDTLDDLVRKGRDLERIVLARALRLHCEHRILLNGRKTVVFD